MLGAGREALEARMAAEAGAARRERQREALARSADLVDAELLLGDAAWR